MATKPTLRVTTAVGDFTRATWTAYTFVNVWRSPRALEAFNAPVTDLFIRSGVIGRWRKDRGFAVTWHGTEALAVAAARKGYEWDIAAEFVGTFPVDTV